MRRQPVIALLALALAWGFAPTAHGDGDPAPADVRKAIDAGAAWLRKQVAEGFADDTYHDLGELVVLALAHAGANLEDKTFAAGIEHLKKVQPRFTYRTALQAMALAEANPRLHQARLAHCAQWFVDTQLTGGEWGYPGPAATPGHGIQGILVAPPVPVDAKPVERIDVVRRTSITSTEVERGDFSNTQFAILGLRACRDAGVQVPKETWKAALDYLRRFQRPDGGWGYVRGGEQDAASYASLTCAAVCSLAICLDALGTKAVRSDPAVRKGLGWLDKNLDPTRNVGIEESSTIGPSRYQYYHLYSLERAGRILGLDVVGKRRWYAEGARWLLGAQQPDGHWTADDEDTSRPSYFTPAETCFAILFLSRSTRPITGP